ncbi:MAG: hypothetical protein RLZ84_1223, partial [Actinomycetota bacterium]
AERILQNRLFAHPKIKVIWDTTLADVLGTDNPKGVTHARLKNVKTGETQDLETDGIFIALNDLFLARRRSRCGDSHGGRGADIDGVYDRRINGRRVCVGCRGRRRACSESRHTGKDQESVLHRFCSV